MAHDQKKGLLDRRTLLKVGALVAFGMTALTACGVAGAEKPPVTTSASGSATPDKTPSASASETSVAPAETDFSRSSIYNNLTPEEQAIVKKDYGLSQAEIEALPLNERTMLSAAVSDANSESLLKVFRANPKIGSSADTLYKLGLGADVNTLTTNSIVSAVTLEQYRLAIAANMAMSGQQADAEKVMAGIFVHADSDLAKSYLSLLTSNPSAILGDMQTRLTTELPGATSSVDKVRESKNIMDINMTDDQGSITTQYELNWVSYDGTQLTGNPGTWAVFGMVAPDQPGFIKGDISNRY